MQPKKKTIDIKSEIIFTQLADSVEYFNDSQYLFTILICMLLLEIAFGFKYVYICTLSAMRSAFGTYASFYIFYLRLRVLSNMSLIIYLHFRYHAVPLLRPKSYEFLTISSYLLALIVIQIDKHVDLMLRPATRRATVGPGPGPGSLSICGLMLRLGCRNNLFRCTRSTAGYWPP